VIAEARQQAEEISKQAPVDAAPREAIDPAFAEIFVRDARKAMNVINELLGKGIENDEDLRTYTIHAHGMKSALANIGENELSGIAKELEHYGREKDTEAITEKTKAFIEDLKALTEKLSPEEEYAAADAEIDEALLHEKLQVIKAACEEFDGDVAEEAISALKSAAWPKPVKELLAEISELLLHSEFDEVVEAVDKYMKG
jgi:HPt (histidine-containing phosphotransfer) domain-containing protein